MLDEAGKVQFSQSTTRSGSQPIVQPSSLNSISLAVADLFPIPTLDIRWTAAEHDRFPRLQAMFTGLARASNAATKCAKKARPTEGLNFHSV